MADLTEATGRKPELAPTFQAARGELFSTSEQDPGFKNDISQIALTSAQQALRDRQYGDDAPGSLHYEERREKEEREKDLKTFQQITWEQASRYAQETLNRLNRELDDIRREREGMERERKGMRLRMDSLDDEGQSLRDQQAALIARSQEKTEAIRINEAAEKAAMDDYDRKYQETYPNGAPGPGEPDPIRESEERLKQQAWDNNRDSIKAQYEAKGLGEEFKILERDRNGEKIDPKVYEGVVDRVRAAGMSAQLDVALLRSLDKDDPLRNTREGKYIAWNDKGEMAAIARQEFYTFKTEEADVQLARIEQRLRKIEDERTALQQQDQLNQDKLDALDKREAKIKEQRDEVVAYQKWLNSDDVKNGWNKGNTPNAGDPQHITLDDFTRNMPAVMRRNYIDNGAECINPDSALGQRLMQVNISAASPAFATVPTATSASSVIAGGIQSSTDLSSGFNTASTTPMVETPDPDTAPVPATPQPQQQAKRSTPAYT